MEPLFSLAASFAAAAVSSLLSAAWEGAALALCVFLLLRLIPRLSAAVRSFIWMTVFLLLVSLHLVPFATERASAAAISRPAPLQLGLDWCLTIAAVWALLSLWRAAQLISSAVRLHSLVKRAAPVSTDPALQGLLQIKSNAGQVRRFAALCSSPEVERPSVLGFFHPRILVPPALLERLTPAELQQVVIHEMEHLRRGDDWTNLIQKIALVLFPLNPALLWVERRLCTERELACDDSVLRSHCGRKAYAICLTHLAEYSMLRRSLSLALGAWERQSELVRRVHRILRRPGASMGRPQTLALTASLIAAVLVCAFGLARSPQLVSFAAPPRLQQAQLFAPPTGLRVENSVQRESPFPAAHAQMVKAIMPSAQLEPVAAKPVQKVSALRSIRRRPAESRQAWVVMTAWSDGEVGARMVLTVAQVNRAQGDPARQRSQSQIVNKQPVQKQVRANRVSYAAVPFGNGWLIIQI